MRGNHTWMFPSLSPSLALSLLKEINNIFIKKKDPTGQEVRSFVADQHCWTKPTLPCSRGSCHNPPKKTLHHWHAGLSSRSERCPSKSRAGNVSTHAALWCSSAFIFRSRYNWLCGDPPVSKGELISITPTGGPLICPGCGVTGAGQCPLKLQVRTGFGDVGEPSIIRSEPSVGS